MKKNIVLIGFMGTGKSVVAKQLEAMTSRRLVSTDELIEQKEGKPISEIFEDLGEDYFRRIEKGVVQEISQRESLIIDCGGGTVLDKENVANLKKNGIIFCLTALPDVIYQRVKDKTHRPLLNVEDPKAKIKELLAVREPYYAQADYTIDTSHGIVEIVAQEILNFLPYD